MMQWGKYCCGVVFFMLMQTALASGPLYFNVNSTGTPAAVSISLCQTGKKPATNCQTYKVSALTLSVLTTSSKYNFASAGIKVLTPGYGIGNIGTDCTLVSTTGYCVFSANSTSPKTLILTVNGPLAVTPTSLPTGTLNAAYTQSFSATGGVSPYSYSVTTGSLPPGLTLTTSGALSGTPIASGAYAFTISASDSNTAGSNSGSVAYRVTIGGSLSLTPTTLPAGELNTAYSAPTIAASGGSGSYNYAVTFGALPPGLYIYDSTVGVISGSPTTISTYNFTVTATDTVYPNNTGSISYTVQVNGSLILSPTSETLTAGTLGSAYSTSISAAGGVGPYIYTITNGSLPPGLSITYGGSNAGQITGTPNSNGTYTFTVTATDTGDDSGNGGSRTYSMTVSGSLPITPASPLTSGVLRAAYSETISASGGIGPYTYSLATGSSLPLGLSLAASTGVISGTPTSNGNYSFTINAQDNSSALNTGSKIYAMSVSGTLLVSPTSSTLPGGNLTTSYNQTFTATGGIGPYSYSKSTGTLPPGLTLSSNGSLSGTPTSYGLFNFTVQATDQGNSANIGTQAYAITISTVLTLTPSSSSGAYALPQATQGNSYSQQITASGGVGSYTYSKPSGTFPTGITLNTSTGLISGTPTSAGDHSFTIQATDSTSVNVGSANYTLSTINYPVVTPTILPEGQTNTAYSQQIIAYQGTPGTNPAYTYSVTSGTLPPGLNLNSDTGVLSGTASTQGVYPITVTATDSLNNSGSTNYTWVISGNSRGNLSFTPGPSPSQYWVPAITQQAVVGSSYTTTVYAVGGSGTNPYAFSVDSSGSLPPGLSLEASSSINGVKITGTPTTAGTYYFTLLVTDSSSTPATGAQNYYMVISGNGLNVNSSGSTPTCTWGSACSWTPLSVSGGTTPYTYSITSGSLPPGLNLNQSTGVITGTPTISGFFNPFTITVTDSSSSPNSGALGRTLAIGATTGLNPGGNGDSTYYTLTPSGQAGTSYSGTFGFLSGASLVYYSGSVPGLSVTNTTSTSGALSGTPSTAANYYFWLAALSPNGNSAIYQYNLLVN